MPKQFTFQLIAQKPPTPLGFEYVNATIMSDGNGAFLYVRADDKDLVSETTIHPNGVRSPKAKVGFERGYKLLVLDGDTVNEVDFPPVDIAFPKFDLFCDGRALLVGARSEWRGPDDFDKNAFVYDPKTGDMQQFLLGDGIADIGIDRQDRIWVSYFDEGVYGNKGWGRPPAPHGVGAGGLVCFASSDQKLWSYNGAETRSYIDDCYALNVTRDDVWAYYYSSFDLCHIDQDFNHTDFGTPSVRGAHTFAVCEAGLLFSHQYRETPDMFHFVQRKNGSLGDSQNWVGELPGGIHFDRRSLCGKGRFIHHINADGWYRISLTNWVSS